MTPGPPGPALTSVLVLRVRAIRGGQAAEIDAAELVPGDPVELGVRSANQ